MSFNRLSKDVAIYLFNFLSEPRDVTRLSAIDKHNQRFARSDLLWQKFLRRDFNVQAPKGTAAWALYKKITLEKRDEKRMLNAYAAIGELEDRRGTRLQGNINVGLEHLLRYTSTNMTTLPRKEFISQTQELVDHKYFHQGWSSLNKAIAERTDALCNIEMRANADENTIVSALVAYSKCRAEWHMRALFSEFPDAKRKTILDNYGGHLFVEACQHGSDAITKMFVEYGINPVALKPYKDGPLQSPLKMLLRMKFQSLIRALPTAPNIVRILLPLVGNHVDDLISDEGDEPQTLRERAHELIREEKERQQQFPSTTDIAAAKQVIELLQTICDAPVQKNVADMDSQTACKP